MKVSLKSVLKKVALLGQNGPFLTIALANSNVIIKMTKPTKSVISVVNIMFRNILFHVDHIFRSQSKSFQYSSYPTTEMKIMLFWRRWKCVSCFEIWLKLVKMCRSHLWTVQTCSVRSISFFFEFCAIRSDMPICLSHQNNFIHLRPVLYWHFSPCQTSSLEKLDHCHFSPGENWQYVYVL